MHPQYVQRQLPFLGQLASAQQMLFRTVLSPHATALGEWSSMLHVHSFVPELQLVMPPRHSLAQADTMQLERSGDRSEERH